LIPEVRRVKVCRIIRTGEKMFNSFRGGGVRTGRAVRRRGGINFVKVTLQFRTVTRS